MVVLHVDPARVEANPRSEKKRYGTQSQREAPVGLAGSTGNDASRKRQLRGHFFATKFKYTSPLATYQSETDHFLSNGGCTSVASPEHVCGTP